MPTVISLAQHLVPPLFLSYFYKSWSLCTFEIGPHLATNGHRSLGHMYTAYATVSIATTAILYLRLYFLPKSQYVPPKTPLLAIQNKQIVFRCLSPEEATAMRLADGLDRDDAERLKDEPMVERCYKGRCGGRWKPSRARHCSQCGVCRAGFDHHCPLFANCLTAPYIPNFLAVLLYTPPTVLLLSSPLYTSLFRRATAAYRIAVKSPAIKEYWWNWPWSWIIAGGPVGRYAGALALGWRELDRADGGGINRLTVGLVVAFGFVLSLITAGLAYSTFGCILQGDLTIDRERSKSFWRTAASIRSLKTAYQPIPPSLDATLHNLSHTCSFYIPSPSHPADGTIMKYTDGLVNPYDHKDKNLEIVLGKGWGWILPWRAWRASMGEEVFNWPLASDVEAMLREKAGREPINLEQDDLR